MSRESGPQQNSMSHAECLESSRGGASGPAARLCQQAQLVPVRSHTAAFAEITHPPPSGKVDFELGPGNFLGLAWAEEGCGAT